MCVPVRSFIHRFRSSLNLHTRFHVCVIDGVFEPEPERGVRFTAVDDLDAADAEAVQARVRRRILRAFVWRGVLDKDGRKEMAICVHPPRKGKNKAALKYRPVKYQLLTA
jgi:hypothetical protein